MPHELIDIKLSRHNRQPWGFRLIGGRDEGLVLKIEKILGLNTPACGGGLKAGDVLVSVNGTLVTLMTHPEVVSLIKGVEGHTLTMVVERGDHIIPSMKECFPKQSKEEHEEMNEQDRLTYYNEAMKLGLGSRLQQPFFTTVGKMKVKVPKYNSPGNLYSEGVMDEMVSGTTSIDPAKLDPNSKAFERLKKTKLFDPKRSSVLSVLNDQINGHFSVDISGIVENNGESSVRKI
eukprot:GFUD01022614.1.p1 GENE.GFUD01022614.1~~GFUD01022614.1.p1  ORF type:complete len:233 (-),score=56.25 GFUD01022614.1:66-764(-)